MRKLLFAFIASFILVSLPAQAAFDNGLSATGRGMGYADASSSESTGAALVTKIGSYIGVLLSFVGVIFLILTLYAGFMWMTAQGNQTQVDKAKNILTAAVIGLLVVIMAYTITTFIGYELDNGVTTGEGEILR